MTKIHDDADARRLEGGELAAIPGVVVQRFTATPEAVVTGGATTVAWKVVVPDSNDIIVGPQAQRELITLFGQKQFTNLTQSTDFLLPSAANVAGGGFAATAARASTCRMHLGPSTRGLPDPGEARVRVQPAVLGNSQFTLRDPKTVATLGSGTIDIAVPLTIHVDSWFDADMDIAVKLSVAGGAGSPVLVLSRCPPRGELVLPEHVPSLGCTHFVEEGMSQLGQALLADIVHSQLVPEVAEAFNEKIDEFCTNPLWLDPLHRTYVLTVFDFGRRSHVQGLPAVTVRRASLAYSAAAPVDPLRVDARIMFNGGTRHY